MLSTSRIVQEWKIRAVHQQRKRKVIRKSQNLEDRSRRKIATLLDRHSTDKTSRSSMPMKNEQHRKTGHKKLDALERQQERRSNEPKNVAPSSVVGEERLHATSGAHALTCVQRKWSRWVGEHSPDFVRAMNGFAQPAPCSQRHTSQARSRPPRRLGVHRLLWFLIVLLQTCVMVEAPVHGQTPRKGNQGWCQGHQEAQEKLVQAQPSQDRKGRDMVACPEKIQHPKDSSHISRC